MQKEMMNVWIIQRQLKTMRSLVFPTAWIWKEVVRNLRVQTRWILESNCREHAAEFRRIRSSDIPLYQCLGERTIKKQSRREDINSLQRKYRKYWVAPHRQSAQSLRSSSGYDWTIFQSIRELRWIPLHQVSWINKKFLHNLFSQKCKPMKSDRKTNCKNASNDLRDYQKTRSYPDYAPKQVWD